MDAMNFFLPYDSGHGLFPEPDPNSVGYISANQTTLVENETSISSHSHVADVDYGRIILTAAEKTDLISASNDTYEVISKMLKSLHNGTRAMAAERLPQDGHEARVEATSVDSLESEYIFDRLDVRIIFITLYSVVFACCFFGE